MKINLLTIALVASVSALSACQSTAEGIETINPMAELQEVKIFGTVTYRERVQLLPGSTLNVQLLDVSRADAPSTTIVEESRTIADGDQMPLAFSLSTKEHMLKENRRYVVRATIIDPFGRLAWTTDTAHPVQANTYEQNLGTLQLVRVQSSATPVTELIGHTWGAENIDGKGIVDNSNVTFLFASDGRVSGSTGCNNFSGEYVVDGDKIDIGPLATTRRACVPALGDQESRFLGVMSDVTGWNQDRWQRMVLSTDDGRILVATQRNY